MIAKETRVLKLYVTARELRQLAEAAEVAWSNRQTPLPVIFATLADDHSFKLELYVDAEAMARGL